MVALELFAAFVCYRAVVHYFGLAINGGGGGGSSSGRGVF